MMVGVAGAHAANADAVTSAYRIVRVMRRRDMDGDWRLEIREIGI